MITMSASDHGTPDSATSESSAVRLKSFIERIERLEEEKAAIGADIKEVFAEAKGTGFDVKIMRSILKLRKMESADRNEYFELLDLYMQALGMLAGTPLGDAAVRSAGLPPAEQPVRPAPAAAEPKIDAALAEKARLAKLPVAEAEEMGHAAHEAGEPVTSNPFPPRTKQRAAWDNGWCKADGSDGMALPGTPAKSPSPAPAAPGAQ
jgi:uncharacterized protein (UPF0335 family)